MLPSIAICLAGAVVLGIILICVTTKSKKKTKNNNDTVKLKNVTLVEARNPLRCSHQVHQIMESAQENRDWSQQITELILNNTNYILLDKSSGLPIYDTDESIRHLRIFLSFRAALNWLNLHHKDNADIGILTPNATPKLNGAIQLAALYDATQIVFASESDIIAYGTPEVVAMLNEPNAEYTKPTIAVSGPQKIEYQLKKEITSKTLPHMVKYITDNVMQRTSIIGLNGGRAVELTGDNMDALCNNTTVLVQGYFKDLDTKGAIHFYPNTTKIEIFLHALPMSKTDDSETYHGFDNIMNNIVNGENVQKSTNNEFKLRGLNREAVSNTLVTPIQTLRDILASEGNAPLTTQTEQVIAPICSRCNYYIFIDRTNKLPIIENNNMQNIIRLFPSAGIARTTAEKMHMTQYELAYINHNEVLFNGLIAYALDNNCNHFLFDFAEWEGLIAIDQFHTLDNMAFVPRQVSFGPSKNSDIIQTYTLNEPLKDWQAQAITYYLCNTMLRNASVYACKNNVVTPSSVYNHEINTAPDTTIRVAGRLEDLGSQVLISFGCGDKDIKVGVASTQLTKFPTEDEFTALDKYMQALYNISR